MNEIFKIEKPFLESQNQILSVLTYFGIEYNFDPNLFLEIKNNFIDEIVYCDSVYDQQQKISEINELIIKMKEGFFMYFSKKTKENIYALKIYYSKSKKVNDIIFQINRIINTK
jgi:hypothetical protein